MYIYNIYTILVCILLYILRWLLSQLPVSAAIVSATSIIVSSGGLCLKDGILYNIYTCIQLEIYLVYSYSYSYTILILILLYESIYNVDHTNLICLLPGD